MKAFYRKNVRNTKEIKQHEFSLKINSLGASELFMVLGVKLQNFGRYLKVNGPTHEIPV